LVHHACGGGFGSVGWRLRTSDCRPRSDRHCRSGRWTENGPLNQVTRSGAEHTRRPTRTETRFRVRRSRSSACFAGWCTAGTPEHRPHMSSSRPAAGVGRFTDLATCSVWAALQLRRGTPMSPPRGST
jgi:hypothetical protein